MFVANGRNALQIKTYILGMDLVVSNYREEVLGYVKLVASESGKPLYQASDGYRKFVGYFTNTNEAVDAVLENNNGN
jgi:hypothetical protein